MTNIIKKTGSLIGNQWLQICDGLDAMPHWFAWLTLFGWLLLTGMIYMFALRGFFMAFNAVVGLI